MTFKLFIFKLTDIFYEKWFNYYSYPNVNYNFKNTISNELILIELMKHLNFGQISIKNLGKIIFLFIYFYDSVFSMG